MLNNYKERFNALNQREKILVTAAALMVTWGIWDKVVLQPLAIQQSQLEKSLSAIDQRIATQKLTALELENNTLEGGPKSSKTVLSDLKNQYSQLENQLSKEDKKFVPPKLMAKLLGDMLNQAPDLSLIKLETLPMIQLTQAKNTFPVYKHGLSISFTGNYFSTLQYLKNLESLPWHFYWENIDYQVKDHPQALTTFTIYTLSFEETWLGV